MGQNVKKFYDYEHFIWKFEPKRAAAERLRLPESAMETIRRLNKNGGE